MVQLREADRIRFGAGSVPPSLVCLVMQSSLLLAEGQEAVLEQQRKDQVVTKLHSILSPFLLRRVKDEIARHDARLQLPPKVRCALIARFCHRVQWRAP